MARADGRDRAPSLSTWRRCGIPRPLLCRWTPRKRSPGLAESRSRSSRSTSPSSIEPGFKTAADLNVQAVLILTSPLFGTLPHQIADAALRRRLPAITMFPEFAEVGGLIAYGTDQRDLYRQSGEMAGKVLGGAKPADLPVERPARILLAVNLKTAATLGVIIPQVILLRADQVIE